MAKLRVISTDVAAPDFELAPGTYRVGRDPDNDWCLPHTSVSSTHCEVTLEDGKVWVQDLGSTNGTFLDGMAVERVPLAPGRQLRLGDVLIANVTAGEDTAAVGLALKARETPAPPKADQERFVPKINRPPVEQMPMPPSFYRALPGALKYPFHGDGWILLIAGTLMFGFISAAKVVVGYAGYLGILSLIFLTVFGSGYLFAYLQRIIMGTGMGDHRSPDWPDFTEYWSDIILPALQLFIIVGVPLVPSIVVLWSAPEMFKLAAIPVALLGLFYMPMGFLAVAMHDTVFALNPLVIFPSIMKVPKAYLATCILLVPVLAVPVGLEAAVAFVMGDPVTPALVGGAVSFYFMCVMARILGLLHFYHREDLDWF